MIFCLEEKCGLRDGHHMDTTGGKVTSYASAKVLKTQCAPAAQMD